MKYSDLSDFEINKLVSKVLLDDKSHWSTWITDDGCRKVWFVDESKNNEPIPFNPCNNPSDAWPIIVENKIAIKPKLITKKEYATPSDYIDGWEAKVHSTWFEDKNPLRAAMIVFLMMNEGETK